MDNRIEFVVTWLGLSKVTKNPDLQDIELHNRNKSLHFILL